MIDIDKVIAEKRKKMLGDTNKLDPTNLTYKLPTINNEKIKNVEDKSFYSIKITTKELGQVTEKEYCDSVQFLFQDVYKHTFLISSRGIGKTYSVHDYLIKTCVSFIKEDLPLALHHQNKQDVQLPIMVGYILKNGNFTSNLRKTLNEILSQYHITQYVSMNVETSLDNQLGIIVSVDQGGLYPFKKTYVFGESFFLTQPEQARNRQFTEFDFIVFDEFEKAFAKSLLDEDSILINTDKLFDNFKDIINSFQRNSKIRFLYLGNITNLNSIIWDYLNIVNFDFISLVNEHKNENTGAISKILIVNLIPLFTNQSMSNYFEDLTTLGISEEELFQVSKLIDEKNIIDEIDKNSFIIFDDLHIFYFSKGICNIERVDIKTMEKLNEYIKKEYKQKIVTKLDDEEIIERFLKYEGYDVNEVTRELVPKDILGQEQISYEVAKIKIYSIGKIILNDTIPVKNRLEFFKPFNKTNFRFKSLREYFIYVDLISK